MTADPCDEERCAVCGQPTDAISGLTCALCGRPFHFASQLGGRDCGIVAPNPASEGGC